MRRPASAAASISARSISASGRHRDDARALQGSAPALTDLVGGHVSMYFSSLPPAIALVKEGKLARWR
jgi:hypothetical protein